MATGTRGPDGKFSRSIDSVRRDNEAASLRAKGWTFQRIADELGYTNRQKAKDGVDRAFAEVRTEGAEEAKRLDLDRIDRLIDAAWQVLERQHVTVSQGKIVGRFAGFAKDPDTGETARDKDGDPIPVYDELEDDAPVLAAIDRIERLIARRGRILGYEAPVRARVEVVEAETVEAAIAELEAELARNDPAPDRGAPG